MQRFLFESRIDVLTGRSGSNRLEVTYSTACAERVGFVTRNPASWGWGEESGVAGEVGLGGIEAWL